MKDLAEGRSAKKKRLGAQAAEELPVGGARDPELRERLRGEREGVRASVTPNVIFTFGL